ncbi:anaerobic ribonucleoside-triphosphate reductase activating protein [bacterium]|nr:anaerobic ribonucleoside-triphosphate reductase activating protein [bacterium]
MLDIRGWQKESLIEWPKKICSVIWVGGCNFFCPWCSNFDLARHPEKFPLIKEKDVLKFLKENVLLDGLAITGGEPSIDKNFKDLVGFIEKVKSLKKLVGIETNGSNPEAIEFLNKKKLVDFWAMDVKAPLDENKYKLLTGVNVDVDKIKKSINLILEFSGEKEFRTTVVPGFLTKKDILEIAEALKGADTYVLQKFHPELAKGKWPENYSSDFLKDLKESCQKYIKNVRLRL